MYRDDFQVAEETSPHGLSNHAAVQSGGDPHSPTSPRAKGHGDNAIPQTVVTGGPTAPVAPPTNGTVVPHISDTHHSRTVGQLAYGGQTPPQMPFPVFDGENP